MRGDIVFGQYLPGNSLIHRLDPRAKLISAVLIGLAVFLSEHWPQFLVLSLLVVMIIGLSKISPVIIVKTWAAIWMFLGFLLIFQVLFTPGKVIYEIGFLRVTWEGLSLGGVVFMRLVLIMSLATTLTFTTSPVSITGAMEILLGPLKKLKVPVHELAMLITIAIRFLPTLYKEANKIMAAQRSRGAAFTHKGMAKIYKTVIPVIVPLFVSIFQRSEELATAMEVRCYSGGEGRTRFREFSYTAKDYVAIAVSCLILMFAGLM